jgi:hypothetical protein
MAKVTIMCEDCTRATEWWENALNDGIAPGYNIQYRTGSWNGVTEPSLVIEILYNLSEVNRQVREIMQHVVPRYCEKFNQECVYITMETINAVLAGKEG